MPLGPKILLKLVKEIKLVENLSERELANPEGAGFDLRVGEIHKIYGRGFLGIEERKTPVTKMVASYKKVKKRFTFEPGSYYLVKTIESVNLPEDIVGYLFTRSTLFRSGIIHGLSQISPGYSGPLVMSLANIGQCKIEIELGARFAHVQFEKIEGGGSAYRGQWKGGRVKMKDKEKQV
jgi:deoxycytidine triphosphate deaminase